MPERSRCSEQVITIIGIRNPMSGTGSVRLGKDGRLRGKIKIKDGDESTFVAVRAAEPTEPISDPPSYHDKWRRR